MKLNCTSLVLLVIIALSAGLLVYDYTSPIRCQQEQTVKSIKELRGRDAVVQLDDGNARVVNQAYLKPGDAICTKWGRN